MYGTLTREVRLSAVDKQTRIVTNTMIAVAGTTVQVRERNGRLEIKLPHTAYTQIVPFNAVIPE